MKKIELVKGEKGYDEMQIAVRGKGFMIAYITAIVVLALLTRFDETTKYINPYAEFVVTVWASMTVFFFYVIKHNAYDRINDTSTGKTIFAVFGIAGLFILAVAMIRSEKMGENLLAQIFIGGCMIINCAFYFIHYAIHRNDDENEDDE